jgi:hypothetical protein
VATSSLDINKKKRCQKRQLIEFLITIFFLKISFHNLAQTYNHQILSCSPSKLTLTLSDRFTETKNQWARDDPAFVAILLALLTVTTIAYALALGPLGVAATFELLAWNVLVDFLLEAVVIATAAWLLCNRYLRVRGGLHTHSLEPVGSSGSTLLTFTAMPSFRSSCYSTLHNTSFGLCLLSDRFVATLTANTLYLLAHAYYWHVTFLGYNALPFLQKTIVFIYPTAVLVVLFFVSLGLGWNASPALCRVLVVENWLVTKKKNPNNKQMNRKITLVQDGVLFFIVAHSACSASISSSLILSDIPQSRSACSRRSDRQSRHQTSKLQQCPQMATRECRSGAA